MSVNTSLILMPASSNTLLHKKKKKKSRKVFTASCSLLLLQPFHKLVKWLLRSDGIRSLVSGADRAERKPSVRPGLYFFIFF